MLRGAATVIVDRPSFLYLTVMAARTLFLLEMSP